MKRGVIYFATGPQFIREAENSATSLKKHNPQLPVVLFTDQSKGPAVFDQVEKIPIKYKMIMKQKCSVFGLTPFEETLYLDTDTKILGDVTAPFALLEQHEFVMAAMRWLEFSQIPPRLQDFEKPHPTRADFKIFNCGVMYYRMNDRTRAFLDYWVNQIHDERAPKGTPPLHDDQEWLMRILGDRADEAHKVSFQLIPNSIYNCRDVFLKQLRQEGRLKEIMIRHEHGLFDPFWVRWYWSARKQLSYIYRRARKFSR